MVQNKPVISVVMSVYNGAKYLDKAIESILSQSYTDFEFIIVDDGSTDNSFEILDNYKDERIKILRQENTGLSKALNYGISSAQGRFIARMDADDIALVDRLKIQYEFMINNPELDIVGGQAWIIDDNSERVAEFVKPIGISNINNYMNFSCPLIHPTYFLKKEVYEELDGYRVICRYVEDYDFILRANEAGYKIDNVRKKVLLYRQNTNSISYIYSYQQMLNTRIILKAHKYRIMGNTDLLSLESAMQKEIRSNNLLFNFSLRNRIKFMRLSRESIGVKKELYVLLAALSSCFHVEVFLSTLRIYSAAKWNNDET